MTIREMYEQLGSDYDMLLKRIPKEALILRLVRKYPEDTSYDQLIAALKGENYEEAFTAAHTMKGVTLNLGFSRLGEAASHMTEALRAHMYDNLQELLEAVCEEQDRVLSAIAGLDPAE